MAVNTILIDFSVDPTQMKTKTQLALVCTNIESILRDYLTNLKLVKNVRIDNGSFNIYQSDLGAITTCRIFSNGIITINIEYYKGENQEPLIDYEKGKVIERDAFQRLIGIKRCQAFLPIKRGIFDRYFPTSDRRLLEYDIDGLVFEEITQFQKVQIVHSKSLGNMLVLDHLQNISEADLVYTDTLMQRGKEDYKDKEIVILGGGDGGLLYKLLREQPKNVIMLEIDEIVMKACAKHMRSICGDVLDSKSGPNYQIIVGDCMKSLDQFISEGRKFDYVLGDLTEMQISNTPSGEHWDFILRILELSFKILKPDGKFMAHVNGANCEEYLKIYESQLMKLQPPVAINKTTAFVPSFMEDWVFYQISFAKKA